MQSLTDLNSHSRTIIEVTDSRPSGVVLDRSSSAIVDQLVTASTNISVKNAVEILEVINYSTANVRYRLTINAPGGFTPTTIAWAVVPAGLTLTTVGNVYTISGIKTAAEWNIIKNPTWNVPSGYAGYPIWYVTAELIWYDSDLAQDVSVEWDIYDDDYFYLADLESKATVACTITKRPGLLLNLPMVATLNLIPDIQCRAVSTLSCVPKITRRITANLPTVSTIVGALAADFMNLEYSVSSGQTISITFSGVNTLSINWGDGSGNTYTTDGAKTHTYSSSGTKTVKVYGNFASFSETSANRASLTKVLSLPSEGLTSMASAFNGCTGINEMTSTLPSTVTNLNLCFANTNFNHSGVTSWNTANVTNMGYAFYNNASFNQDIGSWNTGKVTNMAFMFSGCSAFNQDIGSWNTSLVTTMQAMFQGANVFDQDITAWNVQNVTDMSLMFQGRGTKHTFNQDISTWNVTNVTNISYMFEFSEFNQDISTWNVSNVTNMSYFLGSNTDFNYSLNSWNTINVRYFSGMFSSSTYNFSISNFNTANALSLNRMFYNNTAFNQSLTNFNTAKVTNMEGMFYGATAFNQPLLRNGDVWKTTLVTDMRRMFQNASSFDQDISGWCVSAISTKPSNFDTGTSVSWTTAEKPVWGTCP